MREALAEAERAYAMGEVPVGAVVVAEGRVIARAHNLRETAGDPTAHAELLAIREASNVLGNWRLEGSTVYCTIEPCPMCAGALVLARVSTVVYGAPDPKAGAAGSLMNLLEDPRLNHRVEVVGGILEAECRQIIQRFFQGLRS